MGVFADALHVLLTQGDQWVPQLQRHAVLSIWALAISIIIAVPAGAWLTRIERIAFATISIANLGRTVPSLAVLALVYPFVGTGFAPSLLALVALGIPPILLTTYTGVREVDASVSDAATGMGLTSLQRLVQAELPVASPVIVSGVRTAAVQIVASASLAALIGGGGLGEMILAGLTNMRYDLLVAGALLVALLAVGTELIFTLIERRGLPAGIRALQASNSGSASAGGESGYQAGAAVSSARWRAIVAVGTGLAIALAVAGGTAANLVGGIGSASGGNTGGQLPTVHIGSKDFTEQLVLGELYAQALEAQGYPVERRLNLGATAVADAALKRGEIDVYPEYTGTALFAVLKASLPTAPEPSGDPVADAHELSNTVYNSVESGYAKRGMTLLAQTPFSNGNAIVVTRHTAERLKLTTLSDLARVSARVDFGAVPGFDSREDGLPLLRERYGMQFKTAKSYARGVKYNALLDGKIDAVYGFETDGQIAHHDLVVLGDDLRVWPPYHAVPIVDHDFALHAGAGFSPTINAVSALLDAGSMRQLNDAVDEGREDPAVVARRFLKQHKLDKQGARPTVHVGSKDFTEQFILGELYAQALEARGFPVERHLNLGATAVADAAVRKGRIDLYPEYTGTSLTAVLKQPVKPGMTAEQVLTAVRAGYRARKLEVLAPTRFSNGNAIVVTAAIARKYQLQTLKDLARVAPRLRFGAVPGFDTREDGLPLLKRSYGMRFGNVKSYENGLKYKALLDRKIDAVYGFETDGQIAEHDLVVLTDNQRVWPPYQVTPIISQRLAGQVGPDFAATVDNVSQLLTADTMRTLNTQVDQEKRDPADVARAYLKRHGLL